MASVTEPVKKKRSTAFSPVAPQQISARSIIDRSIASIDRVSITFTMLNNEPAFRFATSIDLRKAYSASFEPSTAT
jgi:hypothetical protein